MGANSAWNDVVPLPASTSPPVGRPASVAGTPQAARAQPWIGRVLQGHFHIQAVIGAGRASTVFRGVRDPDGKPIAIRVFDRSVSTRTGFEKALVQTVEAWGRIEHPDVVAVAGFGYADTGEAFVVCELETSGTLQDLLQRAGALGEAATIRCARQLARALAVAHDVGAIHGNINPRNVFLRDGSTSHRSLRLSDFGLLQLAQFESTDDVGRSLPESGVISASDWMIIGDPNFSAPETLIAGDVSKSTDIYCLTSLLFTLLTGHPPFESHTRLETMNRQLHDPPPAVFLYGAECHVALEALLRRGLDKDPTKRIGSIVEVEGLLEELELRLAHRNAASLPPVTPFPMPRANDSRPKLDPRPRKATHPDAPPASEPRPDGAQSKLDPVRAELTERLVRLIDRFSKGLAPPGLRVAIIGVVTLLILVGSIGSRSRAPSRSPEATELTRQEAYPTSSEPSPVRTAPEPTTAGPERLGVSEIEGAATPAATAPPASVKLPTTRVAIDSDPPGVEVWLEGRQLGVTPIVTELPARGSLQVFEFRREGLIAASEEAVVAGTEVHIRAKLQPRRQLEGPPAGYKENPFQ